MTEAGLSEWVHSGLRLRPASARGFRLDREWRGVDEATRHLGERGGKESGGWVMRWNARGSYGSGCGSGCLEWVSGKRKALSGGARRCKRRGLGVYGGHDCGCSSACMDCGIGIDSESLGPSTAAPGCMCRRYIRNSEYWLFKHGDMETLKQIFVSFSSGTCVRHLVFLVGGVEYTVKTNPLRDRGCDKATSRDKMPVGRQLWGTGFRG